MNMEGKKNNSEIDYQSPTNSQPSGNNQHIGSAVVKYYGLKRKRGRGNDLDLKNFYDIDEANGWCTCYHCKGKILILS